MKNKTKILIWVITLIVIISLVFVIYLLHNRSSSKVMFAWHSFSVELAQTQQERELGLMYRESLDDDKWMLFIFEKPWIYSFWMKNTLIPLDMIWIAKDTMDYKVVDIHTAIPCTTPECPSYHPKDTAEYVLEINSWLAQKYWIDIGSKVQINLKK